MAYDPATMAQSGPRAAVRTILRLACDVLRWLSTVGRSRAQLAAENLFLRKHLALYVERQVKPRRADDATRIVLVALSRLIEWRSILTVVKPDTLIRWHRKGFALFWAVEVQASWATAIADGPSAVDRGDGGCESHLG